MPDRRLVPAVDFEQVREQGDAGADGPSDVQPQPRPGAPGLPAYSGDDLGPAIGRSGRVSHSVRMLADVTTSTTPTPYATAPIRAPRTQHQTAADVRRRWFRP